MQLGINCGFGLVIAMGLFCVGVPNAVLWGAMATILRFVPMVGPWLASIVPVALSLAVFDGWTRPLLVFGIFAVDELVTNNVIEPWVFGANTGISNVGILISALFWTWLWGPVGLVLAMPLTVCLIVLGRHVPQLAFINTLLSDEEALAPASRFYQRLLAMDPDEAIDIAEDYLQQNSLVSLYDDLVLPALSMAEQDRHNGDLDA